MTHSIHPVIKNDIQRYKKNKLGSSLALLGLVFGCVYFIVLYAQVKNNDYYYKWPIAVDVIYNLFFLLFTFLFSEQIKNYNRKMFWFQMFIGAMQVVRIFWLPLAGVTETIYPKLAGVPYTEGVLSSGSFIALVVALAGSAACIFAAGIIGYFRSVNLEKFQKKVESGEVSVEDTLKELEREDEIKAQATANLVNENPIVDNQFTVDHDEIKVVEAEILPEIQTNDQEVE